MSKVKLLRKAMTNSLPDYVRDGLVLWLDGDENLMSVKAEDGTPVTVWRDRAINGQQANVGAVVKSLDAMIFDGINSRGRIADTETVVLSGILSGLKERTVEIVCKLDNADNVQTVFIGAGNTATPEIGAAGLWYRPTSGGFKVGTWDNSPVVSVQNVTNRASYSIVYGNSDLSDFNFYQNGNLCTKGGIAGNMYSAATAIGARLKTDGTTWQYRLSGEICCIRVYNRKLTDAERGRNLEIDRRRFDIDAG